MRNLHGSIRSFSQEELVNHREASVAASMGSGIVRLNSRHIACSPQRELVPWKTGKKGVTAQPDRPRHVDDQWLAQGGIPLVSPSTRRKCFFILAGEHRHFFASFSGFTPRRRLYLSHVCNITVRVEQTWATINR
ncbi:conserved hypothetical protein [Coccidioides posadasii str. Silveira]|uniref:Uncharacterized protein n=2 Tax=Coccidioides posadasii TaxID=199306 RepID=E9D909_COCPS|nr:conserved hypothetical protein [Coccidioides posadasii str. Silveira]KMM69957.1 hypothetical protein CPAG_06269 [Coccidioides posadasii RMSCC 3488]